MPHSPVFDTRDITRLGMIIHASGWRSPAVNPTTEDADVSQNPAIIALRHSHDRLTAAVDGLDSAGLRARAYPSEWSIAQVLSHLGSQAEILGLYLESALAGTPSPTGEQFPPIWERWNGKDPDAQARDGLAGDRALLERIEELAAAGSDVQIPLFGFMEVDVAGFARLRLAEHALHTWDIAVTADPAAQVSPDAVELLVDQIGGLASRTGRGPLKGPVEFRTTAPARRLLLTVGDSGAALVEASGPSPDAVVELPGEALIRLVYGRLDPEHTPAQVSAEGIELDELRAVFPGF